MFRRLFKVYDEMIWYPQKDLVNVSRSLGNLYISHVFVVLTFLILISQNKCLANTSVTNLECEFVEKMLEVVSGPRSPQELFPDVDIIRNFYDSGESIKKYFNAVISRQDKKITNYCLKKFSYFCNKKVCRLMGSYRWYLGFPMNTYLKGQFSFEFDMRRGLFTSVKEMEYRGD